MTAIDRSRVVSADTVFTILNKCSYTIWPGTLCGNGVAVLGQGGFELASGASVQLSAPRNWSGRFWARTGCDFSSSGAGTCTTGDCGNVLHCTGEGVPPASLVEFTLNGAGGQDFYDVSLVDGYNVGVSVAPRGGMGACQNAGCVRDLNLSCPVELQLKDGKGIVVACKSACMAFGSPDYCCTGEHGSPQTCLPTKYSEIFKAACPMAYSYAFDDPTSTCTCSGAGEYIITFCP
ncbi:Pathogenesis-related thaumatin-like protein [Drosera capensis]